MIRRIAWVLLGVCASVSLAQPPDPGWEHRFDIMIEQGVHENHIPGMAIGIVLDGKLAYARGFGQATLGRADRPFTLDTLFDVASVTKTFVATAIMQLVEQGKIDLDAPVIKYLPYFRLDDPRYSSITVRQMVTHTSGMPDLKDGELDNPQNDDGALERYVRSLKGKKLLWAPGAHFNYSNIAFDVLGDVISKVSGIAFEDYVEQKILQPVGMASSTMLLENAGANKMASGYTKYTKKGSSRAVTAELVPAPYPYDRRHGPCGGLIASVNDMVRWAMVNLNRGELDGKRILKNSTYDVMWKPWAEVEVCRNGPCRKRGSQVGISWFLEQKDGQLYVSHTGGDPGFSTLFIIAPARKFAFVIMANSDLAAAIRFLRQVQAEALKLAEYKGL